MTVREAIKMLLEFPMEAELAVALPGEDEMRHIENMGAIPEGPFGIARPNLCYIEIGEAVQ